MKLKNKTIARNAAMSLLLVFGLFAFASVSISAQDKEEKHVKNLVKQAKITMAQAREIASAKAAGKIEEKLEKEHGKLVYSFNIRSEKGTITEVQVDPKDGSIVSVEEENKAAEQKEKQKEK